MSVISCTPRQEDEPDTPDVPTIALAENGVCLYRIVRSDLLSVSAPETKAAVEIKRALEAVLGSTPEIVTDWEDKDSNAEIKEILVGNTNRAESAEVYASLGESEYAVRIVNNKLVIAGDSSDSLRYAVSLSVRPSFQRIVGRMTLSSRSRTTSPCICPATPIPLTACPSKPSSNSGSASQIACHQSDAFCSLHPDLG